MKIMKKYYSSHLGTMTWNEFKKLEHFERENYTTQEIIDIENKYHLIADDIIKWVTPDQRIAHTYNVSADDVDYVLSDDFDMNDIDVYDVTDDVAYIIEETDDGNFGNLAVLYTDERYNPKSK